MSSVSVAQREDGSMQSKHVDDCAFDNQVFVIWLLIDVSISAAVRHVFVIWLLTGVSVSATVCHNALLAY